jgi:hypothetical protein
MEERRDAEGHGELLLVKPSGQPSRGRTPILQNRPFGEVLAKRHAPPPSAIARLSSGVKGARP